MKREQDIIRRITQLAHDRQRASASPAARRATAGQRQGSGTTDTIADRVPGLSNAPTQERLHAEMVVLTALADPERDAVLGAFQTPWRDQVAEGVLYKVGSVQGCGRDLILAVACQNDMGMVPAAILATKAIRSWHPSIVAMTGICAGVVKKVGLGDIIIVQSVFDYGSGKIVKGKLQPDYIPVQVDAELCGLLRDFATESSALSSIFNGFKYPDGRPRAIIKAHVGAFASGAAVAADERIVVGITKHRRSLLGIDMEAYGVAKATVDVGMGLTRFIILKSVADFADTHKGDRYRQFCAYASASFLRKFLERHGAICIR